MILVALHEWIINFRIRNYCNVYYIKNPSENENTRVSSLRWTLFIKNIEMYIHKPIKVVY